jgi:hypothetical protein
LEHLQESAVTLVLWLEFGLQSKIVIHNYARNMGSYERRTKTKGAPIFVASASSFLVTASVLTAYAPAPALFHQRELLADGQYDNIGVLGLNWVSFKTK